MTEHDETPTTDVETTDAEPPAEATPDVESAAGVGRRDYLQTVGTLSMAGLASTATGTAVAQSEDWEAAADERIQEHRTGPLEVEVVDENGDPVSGATVDVEMQSHDYWFGYVMSADLLVNQTEPGHPYREALKEDFNAVWFGNNHKWRFFENEREQADEATAWAKDNGLDVRGHVCLWANVSTWSLPSDVVRAMGVTWEDGGVTDPELDAQHVRDRSFDHVQTIIEHYADFEYDGKSYGSVIEEWEVMNEVVHEPGLIRAINGVPADQESGDIDPVTDPVLGELYRHARDVAPDDVGLATNDFNTMEGSWEYARSDYERQIEYLAANGDLDYVGIQSHFTDRDSKVSPQEALNVLDRYAQHGVRLRVTEYDATGDDWSDEEKADFFHDYLKAVFSHEATDAFLTAGGSDEHHWRDDDPFFYEGWDPKPAYEVYQDLVFDEWWTSESATTDGSGTVTVDAFLGEHEILVDGEVVERTSVTDSDAGQRITVTVDGGDAGDLPPVGDNENAPTDPDGDGLYEDVNGNGGQDLADAVDLYQHRDAAAVQDHVDAYDFSGNDSIDLADVVQLYQENSN